MSDESEDATLKLADFGFAELCTNNGVCTTEATLAEEKSGHDEVEETCSTDVAQYSFRVTGLRGTKYYVPPEVMAQGTCIRLL